MHPAQKLTGRRLYDGMPVEVTVDRGVIQKFEVGRHHDDAWLGPGLIDLQVNGFGGCDVNAAEPSVEEIVSLAGKMMATGVTTFLPTIITSSEEKIKKALRAVAEARQSSWLVAAMAPYVHVEGPHISAVDGPRGAHPVEHVRPPSVEEWKRWQEASGGLVGMVTLSPHFHEAEEYIAALAAHGVHVALGHTDATVDQVRRAVNAGARLSTHLGNGIGAMLPRHPNVLWTQMADDRLTATLIADGHHLPADALKAMIRAKGIARSILVSDAVSLAGMAPGVYETSVGGSVELNASGRLSLAGTTYLAGAALPLKDGVARAMGMAGISLAEAMTMATVNPGRFVDGRGELRVGERADLIRFREDGDGMGLRIETVLVAGRQVA